MPENPKKIKRGFLEEKEFRREYQKYVDATGNSENPYDVEHFYNYSQLFDDTGGIMPHMTSDNHLPSEYKKLGHPNLYIEGKNTKIEHKYGGNMKRKIKKYFGGGNMVNSFLPKEGASDMEAAGQFMALQQLYNQGLNSVDAIGNDILADKIGAEEAAIANQGSATFGKIPIVGKQLGAAANIINAVSGKTGRKIRSFRKNQAVDSINNFQEANDLSGYVDQSKVTFAHGGDLQEFQGPVHEEGGVQLTPEAEVEGGETKKGNYIFSDRLKIPGKKITFAQQSKAINKLYLGKRPNDPISKQAEERELAVLQDMQEIVRGEIMSNAYTKAYGGFLKKKKYFDGGDIDPLTRYESMYDNRIDKLEPINFLENQDPGIVGKVQDLSATDMQPVLPVPNKSSMYYVAPNSVPELISKQIPDIMPPTLYNEAESKKFSDKLSGNVQPLSLDTGKSNNDNVFGMQPADYASAGIRSLAGLSQLYYGLKGPDDVRDANFKLARPNKVNMSTAKRLASQEIDTAFNAVDRDIRDNSGGQAGRYLSNRIASAIKRGRTKGEQSARLSQEEELQNANIMNNFNQFNTQVLNAEEQANLLQEDKRIQEKDAARMAVTEGLNNVGQSVGQTTRDKKAYDWQKILGNYMGTQNIKSDITGRKYYTTPKGSFYEDGTQVPKENLK